VQEEDRLAPTAGDVMDPAALQIRVAVLEVDDQLLVHR